ncbi:MAG: GNAT family N-acetyltransferase [Chloroflexi bacterium]|nr:MAG: GNAT family N-acetyltransferase [Chloroflexota bacterium]
MLRVRQYVPADREFVLSLAPRLAIGIPPWRDPQKMKGRGVGKALAQACEQWAREQGYRILSLATGAANERALGFYRHMGYLDEDVKLVKLL